MNEDKKETYARCKCGLILHSIIQWGTNPYGGNPVKVKVIPFCSKCGDLSHIPTDISGGTFQPESDFD